MSRETLRHPVVTVCQSAGFAPTAVWSVVAVRDPMATRHSAVGISSGHTPRVRDGRAVSAKLPNWPVASSPPCGGRVLRSRPHALPNPILIGWNTDNMDVHARYRRFARRVHEVTANR